MSESAVDRLAVIETCTRMGWHADQREWDALRDLFADEVLLDYTSLQGGEPASVSCDQLVESWAGLLGKLQATQHLMTNHLVTVSEDAASCAATFQATHVLPNPHGDPIWTLGGTYRFELQRDGQSWRISAVTMTATWASGNQQIMALAAGARPEWAHGSSDHNTWWFVVRLEHEPRSFHRCGMTRIEICQTDGYSASSDLTSGGHRWTHVRSAPPASAFPRSASAAWACPTSTAPPTRRSRSRRLARHSTRA